MGRLYDISGLTPLEIGVQIDKLYYMTVLWRAFGNLDNLDDAQVIKLGEKNCLRNGNHRSIWLGLNREGDKEPQVYALPYHTNDPGEIEGYKRVAC